MNKNWFFFLLITLFVSSAWDLSAHGKKATPLPHFAEGITKVSDNGLFSIEIVPEPIKPKVGKNRVNVYLHDAEGKDLEGAIVTLEVWNKDKGTLSAENPKTKETEHGEYIVRNVVYDSYGVYELRVSIRKGNQGDSAVFEIKVKPSKESDMQIPEPPKPYY